MAWVQLEQGRAVRACVQFPSRRSCHFWATPSWLGARLGRSGLVRKAWSAPNFVRKESRSGKGRQREREREKK